MNIKFEYPKGKETTRSKKTHVIYTKGIFIISLICLLFATSTLYAGWLDDISKIKKIVTPILTEKNKTKKTAPSTKPTPTVIISKY